MRMTAPWRATCLTAATILTTSTIVAADEPLIVGGQLVFPEGSAIPKSLTQSEQRWLAENPGGHRGGVTGPPEGPVRAASEYERMDAILLAWEGGGTFTSIVRQMAVNITTLGDADVFIACDSSSEANTVTSSLSSAGADMSRVHPVVRSTDTIWIRDYGPRYVFEGECRAIVDHNYNRPRPNDDAYSSYFDGVVGHAYYKHGLEHGGGNYHLNSNGVGAATELIVEENPGMTEAQIVATWLAYQNVETHIHDAYPTSVDYTQHIDMWMQIIGDSEIIISDWPNDSGSTQDAICDGAANYYTSLGWTVHRVPAFHSDWTHWTYTNMVLCNDLVLLPQYNSISNTWDNQALSVVQAAMPDRTVVQITCDDLAYSAGVMHCICMHMPEHVGGEHPTTCVLSPGAGLHDAGDPVTISWLSDDDDYTVVNVDIEFSSNGGMTWDTVAAQSADDGLHAWTLPDVDTTSAMIRVLGRDADGNVGGSTSAQFTILGTEVAGDANGDGLVNVNDILVVIAEWGECPPLCPGDVTGDGVVNVNDVLLVLANFTP